MCLRSLLLLSVLQLLRLVGHLSSVAGDLHQEDLTRIFECQTSGGFWCAESRKCISKAYLCDQRRNCLFGEDEKGCFNATRTSDVRSSSDCQTSAVFWCASSQKCVNKAYRCDGSLDCLSGEDESDCFTTTRTTVSIPPTTYQCGDTLIDSGYIQSPNYPETYPNNVKCTWFFRSKSNSSNLTVHFHTFDLEMYCDFFYYNINDERGMWRASGGYSGKSLPPTVVLGPSGWMSFSSDALTGFSGFRAYFKSTDITNPWQCTTSDVFWCASSQQCINITRCCDGHQDCEYEEDESQCSSSSKDLSTNLALSIPLATGIAILVISLVVVYRRRCKLKHQNDGQCVPQESGSPVASPVAITFPSFTTSPSQPSQRGSTSDPPLYSDLVNSCEPAFQDPPAYDTVCMHGSAIYTQAELVVTTSTLDPPLYSHVVSNVRSDM